MKPVSIIGIGSSLAKPQDIEKSSQKIILDAIEKALHDTQMDYGQIQSTIFCEKKYNEFSEEISFEKDANIIENLRAIKINEDGIFGLLTGLIQIISEIHDSVMVVGYGGALDATKPSLPPSNLVNSFQDESFKTNPLFIAALEMERYLQASRTKYSHCAEVVVKSKENAMKNPRAFFGTKISLNQVLNSEMLSSPLSTMDVSPWINGAFAIILASKELTKKLGRNPVWIAGFAWGSDKGECLWTNEAIGWPAYIEKLTERVFTQANIKEPLNEINLLEIEDTYSYQVLQNLEATGMAQKGDAVKLFEANVPAINPSGGCLGMGNPFSAKGLMKVVECVLQLRKQAEGNQLEGHLETALIQSSYSLPSRSGGILILKKNI